MAEEKDFGNDYLEFYPSGNGKTSDGLQSEKSQAKWSDGMFKRIECNDDEA